MKRRLLFHILTFFLIGIVLSYLAAWGCMIHHSWQLYTSKGGVDGNFGKVNYVGNAEQSLFHMCFSHGAERLTEWHKPGAVTYPFSREQQYGEVESVTMSGESRTGLFEVYTVGVGDASPTIQLLLAPQMDSGSKIWVAGWPKFCVRSHKETRVSNIDDRPVEGGFDCSQYRASLPSFLFNTVLPYRPLYLNLLFNSALYGLLAYGSWAAFGSLKHNRRKSRGLCPQCKYDLRGDHESGCPECGWGREASSLDTIGEFNK